MKKSAILIILFLATLAAYSQPFGSAIMLDGFTNYIEIPNDTNIDLTQEITLEAWIKPCKITGQNMIFTKLWCTGAQNSYYFTIKDGKLRWVWFNGNCNVLGNIFETNAVIITNNSWQHVAITHTSTGNVIYLNGVAVPSTLTQGSHGVLKKSSQPLRIGTYRKITGVYTSFFTGQIDDARVWKTAQSSANILTRYNGTLTGTETNLVAYYKLDDNTTGASKVVVNDASSTGNTLNGITRGTSSTPFYQNIHGSLILGADTTLCPNNQLTLDANISGTTYTWQDGSTNSTFLVTQPGIYSVSYSNTCGIVSDSITVLYDSLPMINLGNDTSLCFGNNLLLDGFFPGATYIWQDNSTDPTLSVSVAGSYAVTTTAQCGQDADTILVSFKAPLSINLGNDTTLCTGISLPLDASSPNATYLWSDNSINSTLSVNSAGQYWVEVTDACGTATDTIIVDYTSSPLVNLGADTALCLGDTLVLSATNPNSTYLWSNGSSSATINVLAVGTYWVTTSNNCGTGTDTILISSANSLTINIGKDTNLCQGENIILSPNIPNATYTWQDNSSSPTFNVTTAGVFWVSVTNNCGSDSDTINVTYSPLPTIHLGNDTLLCSTPLILDATTTNASYLWSDNSTSPNLSVSTPGTYAVLVTVNNCSASDTIKIFKSNLDLGADTLICSGDTLKLVASNPLSHYIWNTNDTSATITVTNTGTYWVDMTNSCGTIRDSIIITTIPLSNINLGKDTSLCNGDTLNIKVSVPYSTNLWSNGGTDTIYTSTITEKIWITTTNKCWIESDTVNVIFNETPRVNLGKDTSLCDNQTLLLDASFNNVTYLWQNGSTNNAILVNSSNVYWVVLSNNCGTITDSILIDYLPNPNVNLGSDTTIKQGDTLLLDAKNIGASYTWQDGSSNQFLTISQPNTYWVTVNFFTCTNSDSIIISWIKDSAIFILPNIFTPNGDGINDYFIPVNSQGVQSVELRIYNKWGNEVFFTNFIELNWDGITITGHKVPNGTYFWIATYEDENGDAHSTKGNVMLLR